MRRIGLVLLLSAVVAGGSALAQHPPEEKKPKAPQKGDKVLVRGCVSGPLFTAAEFKQTDETGKLATSYTYRLQGPKDVLRALRADHEGRIVDVEAILKSELPDDPAVGTARIGRSRIKIGFGTPSARHTPADTMPYHPVLEVISFEPVGTRCTS
jgi:hypothetical protein